MPINHRPKRRTQLIILIVSIAVITLLSLFAIFHPRHKSLPPVLAATITDQTPFVIYVPGSDWQVVSASAAYRNSILTFTAKKDGTSLTITEQATPSIFTDVPEYYPTLINKFNQYSSLGTVNGTAYLTKPTELKGEQQAVLNNNGTLFFAHPNKGLSNDTWRRFFNNLSIIKPS